MMPAPPKVGAPEPEPELELVPVDEVPLENMLPVDPVVPELSPPVAPPDGETELSVEPDAPAEGD